MSAQSGRITYTISEDGADLTSGTIEVSEGDIVIERPDRYGEPVVRKILPLGDRFRLILPHFPARETDKVKGFAICGGRDDRHTFSWEWFTEEEPGYGVKKVEQDEKIRFELSPTGEVTCLEFLTDVCVRISDFGEAAPEDPKWRILVQAGSEINWPQFDASK